MIRHKAADDHAAGGHGVGRIALDNQLRAPDAAVADEIGAVALHADVLTVQRQRTAPQRAGFHNLVGRDRPNRDAGCGVADRAVAAEQPAAHHVEELPLRVHGRAVAVKAFAAIQIPVAAAVGHDRMGQIAVAEDVLRGRAIQGKLQREALVIVPRHGQRAAALRPLARELFRVAQQHPVPQSRGRVAEQLQIHPIHAGGVGGGLRQRHRGKHPRAHSHQGARHGSGCVLVPVQGFVHIRQTVAAAVVPIALRVVQDAGMCSRRAALIPLALLGVDVALTGEVEILRTDGKTAPHGQIDRAEDLFYVTVSAVAPVAAVAEVVIAAGEVAAVPGVAVHDQLAVAVAVDGAEQGVRIAVPPCNAGGCGMAFLACCSAEVIPVVIGGVFGDFLLGQRTVVDAHAADSDVGHGVTFASSHIAVATVLKGREIRNHCAGSIRADCTVLERRGNGVCLSCGSTDCLAPFLIHHKGDRAGHVRVALRVNLFVNLIISIRCGCANIVIDVRFVG